MMFRTPHVNMTLFTGTGAAPLIAMRIVILMANVMASASPVHRTEAAVTYPLCPYLLSSTPPSFFDTGANKLDVHGVPVHNYGSLYDGAGKQYSPGVIFAYALSLWNAGCSAGMSGTNRVHFLAQVNWLHSHVVDRHNAALWVYHFPNAMFGAAGPWVSAFAEGQALSVLIRAEQIDPEPWHQTLAKHVLNAFDLPVDQGGVRDQDNNGMLFEGVAYPGTHSKILNEFIQSLFGLYEYDRVYHSAHAASLYHKGLLWLAASLPRYDAGWTSMYDQIGHVAWEYNARHVELLRIFAHLTGRQEFTQYADIFALYDTSLPFSISASTAWHSPSNPPRNLIYTGNPNKNTYWDGPYPTNLTIDLGRKRYAAAITMAQQTVPTRPSVVVVSVSMDTRTWTTLKTTNLTWYDTNGKTGFAVGTTARYIRLHVTKGVGPYIALNYIRVEGR